MKKSLLVALLAICFGVSAADVPEVSAVRHSGGIASYKNNRIFPPSATVVPLPMKTDLSWSDKRIAKEAEYLIDNNKTTAILLIERGKIIFEKYKGPANPSSPLFSQSMSKSLTAYTIGNMMCAGQIKSLNDTVKTYVPAFAGLAPGDATLKNVLSMSSGIADAAFAGSQDSNEWNNIRQGKISTKEVVLQYGAKDTVPGKEVRYNSVNTFALAHVADATGGLFENFEKHIWQAAGAESPGYWLYDKDGVAMAQSGLSATGRDWARLAMFTIKQTKASGCIGDFMKAATTAQVPNLTKRIGQAFPGYGYQTWIGNFKGKPSYWWVGYGGQRVGIDPESERIIVLTSWREDYMGDVYKLWGNWQRQ